MDTVTTLLTAQRNDPGDDTVRLALADCLEEAGAPLRGELARLLARLRTEPDAAARPTWEERLRHLLAIGVEPCPATLTNSVGMTFALIPPGTFSMGSPPQEFGRFNDEGPLHPVTLTRGYFLGIHTVTQEQYTRVLGSNPSYFAPGADGEEYVGGLDTSRLPVESVSWDDAVRFCEVLSQRPTERQRGRRYRLPTEAEWEYACRGGIVSPWPFHVGWQLLPEQARFDFRSELDRQAADRGVVYYPRPALVGSYRPNAYGLFDMHGNVWEWCSDRFSDTYYQRAPAVDPPGPRRGTYHVLRGGSWFSRASICRSACRNPVATPQTTGFRVVLVLP